MLCHNNRRKNAKCFYFGRTFSSCSYYRYPCIGDAGLTTLAQITAARATPATGAAPVSPGDIGYCAADAGTTYAVIGSDGTGKFVSGVGGNIMVLSN